MLPHDWLTCQFTGRLVTDRGDASGTGYWSAASNEYCYDLLSIVDSERDWSDCLPVVLGPRDIAGEWHGANVACGTGDNMAAALGIGLICGLVRKRYNTTASMIVHGLYDTILVLLAKAILSTS